MASQRRTKRIIYLSLAVLLFTAGIGLTALVAQRLAKHQRESGRVIYAFSPIAEPVFQYADRKVSLEEVTPNEESPLGSIRLTYGDVVVDLPVPFEQRAHTQDLPGLVEYEDWLRVLRFAPLTGRSEQELVEGIGRGEITDRLCVVVRIPRQGVDSRTWGRVWKRDWMFDIHELLADGSIHTQRFAYPQGRPYDENPPEEVGGVPVLQPGTWEHDAALHTMPEGSGPKVRIIDSALRSVGWPFAGAIIAFSVASILAVLGFMPSREDVERRLADD